MNASSVLDFVKVKLILDENAKLKNEITRLKEKFQKKHFYDEIEQLQIQNKLLSDRLKRFEAIENQMLRDEIEKSKKEDLQIKKRQTNVDANKMFGIPIKKPKEEFGMVTTNVQSHHQDILLVNQMPANRTSLDGQLLLNKRYDYYNKYHSPYGPTGYYVLWIPNEQNITYIFTKEEVELPINLREIYNY